MDAHFRVNSPPVVLETVDEQTIIVNLDTGSYYDLNHSGGRVLEALGRGDDLGTAIGAVAAAYGVERDAVAEPAESLLGRLIEEGILVSDSGNGAGANGSVTGEPPAKPYEDPALAKYTDMQELLLLDPIHEVDGTGWPNRA